MRDLLWLPLNLVQWTLGLLWTALTITAALVVHAVTRSREVPLRMARWAWAPGFLAVTGTRLEVVGIDPGVPEGPALYVSNHQSTLDVGVIYRTVRAPLAFVLKRELALIPFLGWYVRAMGMVIVRRGERSQALATVAAVAALLRSGRSVLTFPEGTRSRDGAVGPFRPAALAPALEAGVPVVPIAIDGTAKILPPAWLRSRPGRARILVGAPIPTDRFAGESPSRARAALADEARARVVELLDSLRGIAARQPAPEPASTAETSSTSARTPSSKVSFAGSSDSAT